MGYKVYFGGTYKELWTEDYTMSVAYEDRKCVIAEKKDGQWIASEGDREIVAALNSDSCSELTKEYFTAAAEVYSTLSECSRIGLSFDRIWEIHRFDDRLSAAELMRILMDDCGFSLDDAFFTAAQSCDDISCSGVSAEDLLPLQPRDAHIIRILRSCCEEKITARHNCLRAEYRSPFGAIRTGDTVELSLEILSGKAEDAVLNVYGDAFSADIKAQRVGRVYTARFIAPDVPMALWYCFKISSESGTKYVCPDASGWSGKMCGDKQDGFRLTVYERDFSTPDWFKKSVMYQIFPDRFAFSDDETARQGIAYHRAIGQQAELHSSLDEEVRYLPREFEKDYIPDDFYGGTFKGIESKLGYLKTLGVSCIYLNPIVEARSNHRYDAADYFNADPILGTNEDFVRLCAQAEKNGIRVILDGVFSHTGADSVYFNRYGHYGNDGACQNEASRYKDWYDFKHYPDDYRCWWGFKELPEVNELDPDWQSVIINSEDSVVKTWLRRGSSGWRLDVADELPDEVLSLIRRSSKAEKPDALILGEVWEDAVIKESYGKRRDYALGCSLDSVMNYPLRKAVIAFAMGKISAYEMRDMLISQQMNYPKPLYYSLMNLMGSHDVPRLRSVLSIDTDIRSLTREKQLELKFAPQRLEHALTLEKLCAAIQFAIPGVPGIYYGDEQGMEGVCDPFNRRPYRESNCGLEDFYRKLSELRNSSDVLSTGEAYFTACNKNLLAIVRYIQYNQDVFGCSAENGAYLIVINNSDKEMPFSVDCSFCGCGAVNGIIPAYSEKYYPLTKKSNDTTEKV